MAFATLWLPEAIHAAVRAIMAEPIVKHVNKLRRYFGLLEYEIKLSSTYKDINPCQFNPCGANSLCNLNYATCGYVCVPGMFN